MAEEEISVDAKEEVPSLEKESGDEVEGTEPKPERIATKDKWAIIAMRVRGHVPERIEPVSLGHNNVMVYHFGTAAWTDYDCYMRGEPIPVADIREVEQADREFKNNLHRFPSY